MRWTLIGLCCCLGLAGRVFAQAADKNTNLCAPVERALSEAQSELSAAGERIKRMQAEQAICSEALTSSAAELGKNRAVLQSTMAAKAGLCAGSSELVQGILQGRLSASALGDCLSSVDQNKLATMLDSWRRTEALLSSMGEFVTGTSDAVPSGSSSRSTSRVEQLAARLGASKGAPPLIFRRLLVEAVLRTAPKWWHRQQSGGATALERWFESSAPLDRVFVEEAQARLRSSQKGESGTALSDALDLIRAYQKLSGCGERAGQPRGCARASTLQHLLETSGPLLARRRVQEIWAADCSSLSAPILRTWLEEFPASTDTRADQWREVLNAASSKLYSCFLEEDSVLPSFTAWVGRRVPNAGDVHARMVPRIEALRTPGGAAVESYNHCAQAVHALRRLATPRGCSLPDGVQQTLAAWVGDPMFAEVAEAPLGLRICAREIRLLWEGKAAAVPSSFPHPPTASDFVIARVGILDTPIARLRQLCNERLGQPALLIDQLSRLAALARSFGESPRASPWRLDNQSLPIELGRFRSAEGWQSWLTNLTDHEPPCRALGLDEVRCQACEKLGDSALDCALAARLQHRWSQHKRVVLAALFLVATIVFGVVWLIRLLRAIRRFGGFLTRARTALARIGVEARPVRSRFVFPSHWPRLVMALPRRPAWERWGARAALVGTRLAGQVDERDVHRAGLVARTLDAEVAFVVHGEGAAPTLPAVRAVLEWAGRPSQRAVHILPVSIDRLEWARSSDDLLEQIEDASLRSNPFEVRGRITSSGQFWNRELLVSGLLASAEAGRWVIVTGLRRFGKSSLALEVARRLPGPSSYVDLAGFHLEMAMTADPARAADTILRYVCVQLHSSARQNPDVRGDLPDPPPAGACLDAPALAGWLRAFRAACASPKSVPATLIILDELEQAIGAGPVQLPRSLLVLSTVMGRLRNALTVPSGPGEAAPVGLLLCSALHPVLWAPMATLAHQSLMGAFESVCVPRLPAEVAQSMMRSLGARQGIRFTEEALSLMVEQAQGVPLLLRRLGSSVLEHYDGERARQGGLGAVEIGIEGARAAIGREEEDGAPLRVWVESEIADRSPAGLLLRELARKAVVSTAKLRVHAKQSVLAQFAEIGLDRELAPEEAERRAAEAAGVLVRMLGVTGLLEPEGDLTHPDAYRLPDGLVKRILEACDVAASAMST
jgi:hypothetical protein